MMVNVIDVWQYPFDVLRICFSRRGDDCVTMRQPLDPAERQGAADAKYDEDKKLKIRLFKMGHSWGCFYKQFFA